MTTVKPTVPEKLEIVGSGPSIYVEGINQMMVGFPISRLTFYNLVERTSADSAAEIRHHACELVMPTSTLIEVAQNILAHLSANKELLESAKAEWVNKNEALFMSLAAKNQ